MLIFIFQHFCLIIDLFATANRPCFQSSHEPSLIQALKNLRLSMLKNEFFKKWIKGLQICYSSKKQMNTMERKKKIKLCADIAMASAKRTPTSWSNALIYNARKCEQGTVLVDKLIGPEYQLKLQKATNNMISFRKRVQCKKILKKSCNAAKKRKMVGDYRLNVATVIAKRLVKKRTKVLKSIVPGGESLDEFSLIKEALDYILSLKVQVDVMRSVVNATEVLNGDKVMKSVK